MLTFNTASLIPSVSLFWTWVAFADLKRHSCLRRIYSFICIFHREPSQSWIGGCGRATPEELFIEDDTVHLVFSIDWEKQVFIPTFCLYILLFLFSFRFILFPANQPKICLPLTQKFVSSNSIGSVFLETIVFAFSGKPFLVLILLLRMPATFIRLSASSLGFWSYVQPKLDVPGVRYQGMPLKFSVFSCPPCFSPIVSFQYLCIYVDIFQYFFRSRNFQDKILVFGLCKIL